MNKKFGKQKRGPENWRRTSIYAWGLFQKSRSMLLQASFLSRFWQNSMWLLIWKKMVRIYLTGINLDLQVPIWILGWLDPSNRVLYCIKLLLCNLYRWPSMQQTWENSGVKWKKKFHARELFIEELVWVCCHSNHIDTDTASYWEASCALLKY